MVEIGCSFWLKSLNVLTGRLLNRYTNCDHRTNWISSRLVKCEAYSWLSNTKKEGKTPGLLEMRTGAYTVEPLLVTPNAPRATYRATPRATPRYSAPKLLKRLQRMLSRAGRVCCWMCLRPVSSYLWKLVPNRMTRSTVAVSGFAM